MKTIKTIGILVSMLLSFTTIAQPWSIDPNNFQFSMTITGEVSLDGDIINQQDAYVGAFVEGECRGVSPTSENGGNYKLFLITIYSNNVEGELVEFKLMDENDVEIAIANTILFKNDANYGSADSPFLWMDNVQYASTDFLTFELDSQITSATINTANKTISIIVSRATDKSSLIPTFTLAPEAIAYINEVEQVSEQTTNNYTNLLHYTVKGVDGVESDWAVDVKFDDSGIEELQQTSSFSIYPNPANNFIVITSEAWQPQASAVEIYNVTGKLVKQVIIKNTKTKIQISDLEEGIYFVKIGSLVKKIILL